MNEDYWTTEEYLIRLGVVLALVLVLFVIFMPPKSRWTEDELRGLVRDEIAAFHEPSMEKFVTMSCDDLKKFTKALAEQGIALDCSTESDP